MKRIFACLLGLLGFAGCDDVIINGGEEYGTPYVEFSVKGAVTDGEKAIENVEMKLHHIIWTVDSCKTDTKGQFKLSGRDYGGWDGDTLRCELIANDLNNKYQNDTIEVNLVRSDFSGKKKNDHWCSGSAEKTVNVTLKKNP